MIHAYGADYSHARPTRAQLAGHGITFVCRYLLDDARDAGKALKLAEARQLSEWGVDICANFEFATRPALTYEQGARDARTATAELQAIGAPRRVVYFSFDYDVPYTHFAGVLAYLRGAGSVLGLGNVGAYGHYALIEHLADNGIRWLWQTYAWSNGKWSPRATVRQVHNGAFPGEFDGDLNHAMQPDIGQWNLRQEADVELTDKMDEYVGFPTVVGKVLASNLEFARGADSNAKAALQAATSSKTAALDAKAVATDAAQQAAVNGAALSELKVAVSQLAGLLGELITKVDALEVKAGPTAGAIADELAQRLAE